MKRNKAAEVSEAVLDRACSPYSFWVTFDPFRVDPVQIVLHGFPPVATQIDPFQGSIAVILARIMQRPRKHGILYQGL